MSNFDLLHLIFVLRLQCYSLVAFAVTVAKCIFLMVIFLFALQKSAVRPGPVSNFNTTEMELYFILNFLLLKSGSFKLKENLMKNELLGSNATCWVIVRDGAICNFERNDGRK